MRCNCHRHFIACIIGCTPAHGYPCCLNTPPPFLGMDAPSSYTYTSILLDCPPHHPAAYHHQVKFVLDFGPALGGKFTARPVAAFLDPFLRDTLANVAVWPQR